MSDDGSMIKADGLVIKLDGNRRPPPAEPWVEPDQGDYRPNTTSIKVGSTGKRPATYTLIGSK